jgi:hypothetical protein
MNTNDARAEIIASFEQNILDLIETIKATPEAELGQYIIMCDGLAIDVNGKPGIGGMVVPVKDATRFKSLATAQALAARVVNGMGERGVAVKLADALNTALLDINACITTLKGE